MSTILKTLRKLEEEKSVLDQNLDITGMILHGETSPSFRVEKKRSRIFGLIVTLILAAVLVALATVAFKIGKWKPVLPAHLALQKPAPPPGETTPKNQREVSLTGISLSQIPEDKIIPSPPTNVPQAPRKLQEKPKGITSPPVLAAALPRELPQRESSGPPTIEARDAASETVAEAEDPPAPSIPSEAEMKINPALKNLNAIIEGGKVFPSPEPGKSPVNKLASAPRAAIAIPGLKVKGIVYFSENNPANYLLASTPDNPKGRYKVGDNVQNAVLKRILPNKAIFNFKNQTAELGIGE